jgi:MFS family permease
MPQDLQQPAEHQYTHKQVVMALVAIFTVNGMMAFLMQTLGIARPKIAAQLNGMPLYAWGASIASLVSAFSTLIFSKFSDIYGRRRMLLISLGLMGTGIVLCSFSRTYEFLIAAGALSAIGTGAMMPLVFAVIGDLFPPSQRGKWIGLLNIPTGVFALFGPRLGGHFADIPGYWRYLYWMSLPLLVICLITVPIGVPSIRNAVKFKIDALGCILVGVASSTTILGLSFAGDRYSWASWQVILLLGTALLFWVLFFKAETLIREPILDPVVFRNRSFLTVAVAGLFSFFGQIGMMMYFPMLLQGLQGYDAKTSAWAIMPFSVLISFMGVPVGFLIARMKRYRGVYILSYGILTVVMFWVVSFTATTPFAWAIIAAALTGIGLGAVPTMNTMVVQNAVPKRMLGVAMGAVFFILLMGIAIAPAVLGSAWNSAYAKNMKTEFLKTELQALKQAEDEGTLKLLADSKVLLSPVAMKQLEQHFNKMGKEGKPLFQRTVQAIRGSMEAGLRRVFLVGAIAMLLALLLISTFPDAPSYAEEKAEEPRESAIVAQPSVAE